MTIKWEYDIEGTVEEIKELLGMMQPKAVVQEEPPKAEVKALPSAEPKKGNEKCSNKLPCGWCSLFDAPCSWLVEGGKQYERSNKQTGGD